MSDTNIKNGESLKGNFAYNLLYQILVIILPLITAPYVTRVLGADNLGVYTYSQAIASCFYLLAMLGVNNYGNRAIARIRDDREKLNATFTEIFIFQFFLGVLCTIIYSTYIIIFVKDNKLIFFLQVFYVLSGAVDINWACFGLEKFRIAALRSMIIRISLAVCIFVFVKSESDIWLYTLLLSLQYLISVITIWPFVFKYVSFKKVTFNGVLKHIKPNIMLFFPIIAISIYNIMDKVMLGYFSPSNEVAFYNYAERLVTIPVTCIMALDNVLMPRMSYLYAKRDNNTVNMLMDTIMMFSIFLSSAMCFGLAGVGKDFTVWFYGDAFERCGLFVLLLTPTIIFKGAAGALRTLFIIPTQKDHIYLASLIIGAVVNVIINSMLIPKYGGIGAIIGTVAAEFAVCFSQFFMTKSEITINKFLIDTLSFSIIGILMFLLISKINIVDSLSIINIAAKTLAGALFYVLTGSAYMILVRRNVVIVNEILHILRSEYRFK